MTSSPPKYRKAEASDAVFIASLLREFYKKVESAYGFPFDYPSAIAWVQTVIRDGHCLIGKSSCAAALLIPYHFNRNVIVAHVTFWYFRTAREILILDKLIEDCRWLGATHLLATSHYPDKVIGRRYEAMGMESAECNYIGEINKMIAIGRKCSKRRE